MNWNLKGKYLSSTAPVEPLKTDDSYRLTYINNQKIIRIATSNSQKELNIDVWFLVDGVYYPDYNNTIYCKSNCSSTIISGLHKADEYTYFLPIDRGVFKTIDGGISWFKTDMYSWKGTCSFFSGDIISCNPSFYLKKN